MWEENGKKVASVRMGAATLNEHYAKWAKANGWTMPANTIQHLMTIGGVATPMCHGGGLRHKTIADRILKIGKTLYPLGIYYVFSLGFIFLII